MNREELAWAAGFFDGEGCFNAPMQKARGRHSLQATVSQVHTETLERFREAVGFGVIYGPIQRTVRPIWTWKVGSYEQVQMLMCVLWPWLSPPKKPQAAEAVRLWRSIPRRKTA